VSERNPVLTPAQAHTLEALETWMGDHRGQSPMLRELAEACGVSVTATRASLDQLEEKGFIRRARYAVRGIEILEESA
jgi:DNA-binding MarR family transcriptional regulator